MFQETDNCGGVAVTPAMLRLLSLLHRAGGALRTEQDPLSSATLWAGDSKILEKTIDSYLMKGLVEASHVPGTAVMNLCLTAKGHDVCRELKWMFP